MSRCPHATEWVLYAAGELSSQRLSELAEHLQACDACRQELATLRRGFEAMETLDRLPTLRAEALQELRRRLAAEADRQARPSAPASRLHPMRWATAAAALAAAVAAVVLLWPTETDRPTWPDPQQVDEEIVEITAELELLETDTFATAWDLGPVEQRTPPDAPKGQSRRNTAPQDTRDG